ncbi:MAG: hypothetical protein HQM13_11135 [SAR324 cluster bacterium]|nr:hypothetical protein [SAR324 cluster bacterium]
MLSLTGRPAISLFAQTQDSFFQDDSLDTFQEEEFSNDLDLNELDFEQLEDSDQLLQDEPTDFQSEDQTDVYVDEDVLPDNTQQLLDEALRLRGTFLQQEKVNFAPNILYGVGTGLMIGGWFALLTANSSRDTLRSIGLGIVLGGVMGSIIGGRSVLTPNAPRPQEAAPPAPTGKIDLIPQEEKGLTLAFQWKF